MPGSGMENRWQWLLLWYGATLLLFPEAKLDLLHVFPSFMNYTLLSNLFSGGLTTWCWAFILLGCCSWVSFLCDGRAALMISLRLADGYPGGLPVSVYLQPH